MKRKHYLLVSILFLFVSCAQINHSSTDTKQLDLSAFKISVPKSWTFDNPGEQEDSFIGRILGPGVMLSFDCSSHGYANSLIESEKQYLNLIRYQLIIHPESRPDTGAESNNKLTDDIANGKTKQSQGIDTTVQIDKIDLSRMSQFPKADYIARLKISEKINYVPITIPALIKSHHILIDTNGDYITKTIWPKVPGKGMTGVYIHSRTSAFNFQMNANNLSLANQEQALSAFKTIKFK
ncbi:MAG: hypothetical protein ABJA76_06875 [Mucilaginibacter sp.]